MTLEKHKHLFCPVCKGRTETQSQSCAWRATKGNPAPFGKCHLLPPNPLGLSSSEQLLLLHGFNGKEKRSCGSLQLPRWREGMEKRQFLSPNHGSNEHLSRVPLLEVPCATTGSYSLLQQDGSSCHQRDPPPVPHHDDQNAGRQEGFHGKPHLGETPVLMDALRKTRVQGLTPSSCASPHDSVRRGTHVEVHPKDGLANHGHKTGAHGAPRPPGQVPEGLRTNANRHSSRGEGEREF